MAKRRYALRDDQWERIEGFLPGREGHVGERPGITGYSSKPSCTGTAPGSPGAICWSGSGISA
jgi:hypothetical protein